MEISIAAGKCREILGIFGEFFGDSKLVHSSEEGKIFEVWRDIFVDVVVKCFFKVQTLTSLVVDKHSIDFCIAFVCTFFVGHHYVFVVIEIGHDRE